MLTIKNSLVYKLSQIVFQYYIQLSAIKNNQQDHCTNGF